MTRLTLFVTALSISLLLGPSAWAQGRARGRHARPRAIPAQPAAAANQAGQFGAANAGFQNFGFGGGAFGPPWVNPAFGYRPAFGYAPVYGYMPVYGVGMNGFSGGFGGGGSSTTFFGSNLGGQSYFSSPAYGHWGAFGK